MALFGGSAGKKARKARRRAEFQLGQQRATLAGAERLYTPYQEFGKEAMGSLRQLMADPSKIRERPGYLSRLKEGQRVVETGAAAKGKLFSGQTLKELTRFGQEFATSELDKEYTRLMGGVGVSMAGAQGVAALRGAQAGTYGTMAQVTSQLAQQEIQAGTQLTNTLISSGLDFLK